MGNILEGQPGPGQLSLLGRRGRRGLREVTVGPGPPGCWGGVLFRWQRHQACLA